MAYAASEESPLLAAADLHSESDEQPRKQQDWPSCLILGLMLLFFLSTFAFFHLLAPKTKLLELTICRTYYNNHDPSAIIPQNGWPGYDISEEKCKVNSVQQDLARLKAWGSFLEALCSWALKSIFMVQISSLL